MLDSLRENQGRRPLFTLLSQQQLEAFHYGALDILVRVGIVFQHDKALEILHGAGCSISGENLVKIPSWLIEQAIQQTPKFSLLKPDTRIVIWTPPANSSGDYQTVLTPLMRSLSRLKASDINNFVESFGNHNRRRASPLWVSTYRLQNDGWALILTYLQAKYLPGQPGNQQKIRQLATNFLNSPPTGWSKIEVQP